MLVIFPLHGILAQSLRRIPRRQVGRTTICDAIASGARSAAEIGLKLKAGTNCGSCIPELKRLIAQSGTSDQDSKKLVAAN